MQLIYFDESGNTGNNLSDPNQPIFVLAAMIVPVGVWQSLESKLNDSFRQHFPSLYADGVEVHATNIVSGRNEFKGLPLDKRIEFRDEWMNIGKDMNLKVCYQRVFKQAYSHWQIATFGRGVYINPQISAFALLATELDSYLDDEGELGMFIFDDNKEVTKDIEKSLRVLRATDKDVKIKNVIEKGFFIDSGKSRLLQLCDLFVFAARKKEESKAFGTNLKHPMKSAIPILDTMIYEGKKNTRDVLKWLKETQ